MLRVDDLKADFWEKLAATKSFDQAFTKAVWISYKAGVEDGKKEIQTQNEGKTDA